MSLQQWIHIRYNFDIPWKTFVRESPSPQDKSPERCIRQLTFQGNEAKAAYEEIIHQTSNSNTPPARLKHLKSKTTGSQGNSGTNSALYNYSIVQSKKVTLPDDILAKVTINTLLKAVEQKDLKFLQKHMTTENVNVSDDFGWTPLMSAAYCGHLEIVQFLLNLGANKRTRDRSGLTAAQLALKKNYLSIVALLKKKSDSINSINQLSANINNINALSMRSMPIESSVEHNKDNVTEEKTRLKQNAAFYCEICKATFQETTPQRHESSTLHIFNTKPKLKLAMYGISRQNKGYRMLLNTGWDEEAGLGPSGKGIKYPIKTCLKIDRKGLGQLVENEYKITHFKSGDTTAINNSKVPKQKPLKKRDRERLLHREARKERALRIALS